MSKRKSIVHFSQFKNGRRSIRKYHKNIGPVENVYDLLANVNLLAKDEKATVRLMTRVADDAKEGDFVAVVKDIAEVMKEVHIMGKDGFIRHKSIHGHQYHFGVQGKHKGHDMYGWKRGGLLSIHPRHGFDQHGEHLYHGDWLKHLRFINKRYLKKMGRSKRRRSTRKGASSLAKGNAKKIKRIMRNRPELKFVDTVISITETNLSADKAPVPTKGLNSMVRGTTASTRIGNRIELESVVLKFNIKEVSGVDEQVRCMVIWDKDPQAVPLVESDFLQETGSETVVRSFYKIENSRSYRILWDHTFVLSSGESSSNLEVHKRIKLKGKKTFYDGNGGGVSDIEAGALLFYAVSNRLDAVVGATLTGNARLRYRDA